MNNFYFFLFFKSIFADVQMMRVIVFSGLFYSNMIMCVCVRVHTLNGQIHFSIYKYYTNYLEY